MYRFSLPPHLELSDTLSIPFYSFMVILLLMAILPFNESEAAEYSSQDLLQAPNIIKKLLKERELYPEDVPNPHWRNNACVACHNGDSNFGKSNLRSTDFDEMCGNCHNERSLPDFSHPSGNTIAADMWQRIPKKFKQSLKVSAANKNKTISCGTCHDMPMQCVAFRRHERPTNPNFLRLGPYRQRTDMCFICHNKGFYQRLSPHEQIVSGKLDKTTCKICHRNTDNLNSRSSLQEASFPNGVDLSELCTNCHPWRPHPGWEFTFSKKKAPNHLVKPSKNMRQRMKRMQHKTGILLPIGQSSGKIHCGTCHNPHQKGVVKSTRLNAGADSRKRMRMKKTCSYCHDI